MRRLAVVVLVALTPACKQEAAKDPPAAAKVDAGAAAEVSKTAAVYLDELKLGDIDGGKAGTFPPIQGMLPPEYASLETWASVEVKDLKGRTQKLIAPAKTHPGEIAAMLTDGGGVGFGFFQPDDLAKKGKPKLLIPSVVEVRVHTVDAEPPDGSGAEVGGGDGGEAGGQGGGDGAGGDEGGERPTPTAELQIHIKVGGKDTVFDGTQLAKVPSKTAPVGDTETPGWTLPDVLEAAGVKVKSLKGTLVLYGDEGANLILDAKDLDPAKTVAFLKLNRQGKLRFRLFRKSGTTWDVTGELRGIASIEMK